MIKTPYLFTLLTLIISLGTSQANAEFESVTTSTFDDEKFNFPRDIQASPLALLFLAMGTNRKNGQLQQQQLLEWHMILLEHSVFSQQVTPYHFSIMQTPPFFVKGIIRRAIAEAYEEIVAPSHGAVIYIKDIEAFANQAGLSLNEKPTIVLMSEDGKVLKEFKGEFTEKMLASVLAAIKMNLPENAAPSQ